MKLNIRAFALASAIIWGVGLFVLTWWVIAFEGSSDAPTAIGKLYRGYTFTPLGSVIGLVWGFFDALVGCALFALLYNWLVGQFAPKAPKQSA